jgi:hypothetical protein
VAPKKQHHGRDKKKLDTVQLVNAGTGINSIHCSVASVSYSKENKSHVPIQILRSCTLCRRWVALVLLKSLFCSVPVSAIVYLWFVERLDLFGMGGIHVGHCFDQQAHVLNLVLDGGLVFLLITAMAVLPKRSWSERPVADNCAW